MRTTLRKVGNSRGVLIPVAFLSACQISNEIEMRQEGTRIIIEPVKTLRAGWFNGYQAAKDTDVWTALEETCQSAFKNDPQKASNFDPPLAKNIMSLSLSPAGSEGDNVTVPSPSPLSGQHEEARLSRLRALSCEHPKGLALTVLPLSC